MKDFATLSRFLSEEAERPYVLGQADCFLMAMRMTDAVLGGDVTSKFLGRYTTLRGAHRVMLNEGHRSLTTLFEDYLEPIQALAAHWCDIGVVAFPVEGSDRAAEHAAVHDGQQWRVKTEAGLVAYPTTQAVAAFRT